MKLPRLLQFYNEEDIKILTKKLPKCKTSEDYTISWEYREIMFKICKENNGVWLSSHQIWIQLKFFVIYTNKIQELYVNPKLISGRWEKRSTEWCLSWDNWKRTEAKRFTEIDIEYEDEFWITYTDTLWWLWAVVYQHELDHMKWKII